MEPMGQCLNESDVVLPQMYGLGGVQPEYCVMSHPRRLSFCSKTLVNKCEDFKGAVFQTF